MSSPSFQARAVQATTFSPRLQHAVRLLQMSSVDFAQTVLDEASGNPFLDVEEAPTDASMSAIDARTQTGDGGLDAPDRESDESARQEQERFPEDWRVRSHAMPDGTEGDALQALVAPASLRAHLHQQIGVLRLTDRDRAFASAVVEAVDDDGYLRVSLEDIAVATGEAGAFAMQEWHTALRRVQALEPTGVAARTVGECLSLQLDASPESDSLQVARRIVSDHIEALAKGNIPRLAKAVGASLETTTEAVRRIRRLDAHPGARYGQQQVLAITPDVTVRRVRGCWTTQLNKEALPRVQLNRPYVSWIDQAAASTVSPEMQGCLERARWTLSNLAQRGNTILAVARAIVSHQKLFLEYGPLAMKPLGLSQVAEEVGVHASTVSRAVHGKYMATPCGVFELRSFFARGLDHATGSASAPTAMKGLIQEMICAETAQDPLSDAALARVLAQQGFSIARRTVTKYRQALGIEAIERRRADSVSAALSAR